MRRREFISLIGSAAAALRWSLGAQAQEMGMRIGFLRVGSPPAAWIEAMRQGLRELGHIEGQNHGGLDGTGLTLSPTVANEIP